MLNWKSISCETSGVHSDVVSLVGKLECETFRKTRMLELDIATDIYNT